MITSPSPFLSWLNYDQAINFLARVPPTYNLFCLAQLLHIQHIGNYSVIVETIFFIQNLEFTEKITQKFHLSVRMLPKK